MDAEGGEGATGRAQSAPMEVELKLALPQGELWKLRRHPALRQGRHRPVASDILSVYYDTPDFALKRQGIAVRLRRAGDAWVQTVKLSGTSSGGLHRRPEWEYPAQPDTLDFSGVTDLRVRSAVTDSEIARALYPVFVTRFHRSARLIDFPDGDRIELCIDRGEIEAHGSVEPICEVELELKSGNPARLFELALALQADLSVHAEPRSKAERGYRLASGAPLAPARATAPGLERSDSVHDALVKALAACLVHLQANEAGAIDGRSPEFLHQARVALRRMRSILGVFRTHRDLPVVRHLVDELRWLSGELNDARNWDVFRAEWLEPVRATLSDASARWLETEARVHADVAASRAREALSSPRYRRLVLESGALLVAPPWSLVSTAEEVGPLLAPVRDFARKALARRDRALRRRCEGLAEATDERRHEARIAAKKMRYTLEILASLWSRKDVRPVVTRLADLQDILGSLNDVATADGLVRALPAPTDAELAAGLATLKGYLRGAARGYGDRLDHAWQAYAVTRPFWK